MSGPLLEDEGPRPVRFYTKARKMRVYVAKLGTWKLPRGPYPVEAFVVLIVGLIATIYAAPRSGNPISVIVAGVMLSGGLATLVGKIPYTGVSYRSRALRLATHIANPSNATYAHNSDLRPVLVGGKVTIAEHITEPSRHAREPDDLARLFDEHNELPTDFFAAAAPSGRR